MQNRTTPLLALLLLFNIAAMAQQPYPKTLLWRIEGKGLSKPSYVFGSMHLQDRRLFYFTDSLYHALETTEGFAMEVSPDEMADSILSKLDDINDRSQKLKDVLSDKEFEKVKKQLEKKYHMPAEKITTKQVKDYRRKKIFAPKKNDMPTIVDLYLFKIAKQQGKWTGGIEDVSDQLNLVDEMGGSLSPRELVEDDDAKGVDFIETMKDIYVKQDLEGIHSFTDNARPFGGQNPEMIRRNLKMSRRIDSLSAQRSCLFVVGAAHLPGDSGLISLLKSKGFSLYPVISEKKIAPEDYTYKHSEKEWINFTDDNSAYTVQFPGKPTLMNVDNFLPLNMYMDLADMSVYGVGVLGAMDAGENITDKMDKLVQKYKSQGYDIIDKKVLDANPGKGLELFTYMPGNGYYRIKLLGYENKVFMQMFGGQTKETASSPLGDHFMNSLVINTKTVPVNEQWKEFTDAQCGIKVNFPGQVKVKPFAKNPDDNGTNKVYTSTDLKQGSYYLLLITELGPGYYLSNDSTTFASYRKYFEDQMDATVLEQKEFDFNGYAACRYECYKKEKNEELSLICHAILRGNRTYLVMAILPKEKRDFPEVSGFFRSVQFVPYDIPSWKNQSEDPARMQVFAPVPFVKKEKDSLAYDFGEKTITAYSKDPVSGACFTLEKRALSKYYWCRNDSAFVAEKQELVSDINDSVIYKHSSSTANAVTADFIVSIRNTRLKKQLRYLLTNDTVYCLFGFLNEEMQSNKQVQSLFSKFNYSGSEALKVFSNKSKMILQDLGSPDSLTRSEARDMLSSPPFSKTDLPDLWEALLKQYPADSGYYRSSNDMIADVIKKIGDNSTVDFIDGHYTDQANEKQRFQMLNLLTNQKTAYSYSVLKKLLLTRKAVTKPGYATIYALSDSLALTQTLFPECGELFSDSTIGPILAGAALDLVDSNMVKIASLAQFEPKLAALAHLQQKRIQTDPDTYQPDTQEIINLLGKFSTAKSNDAIREFLALKAGYQKQAAIIALLKNNENVPPKDMLSIAADTGMRVGFYDELKTIKKDELFPAVMKTRLKFAESYAYTVLSEDYEYYLTSLQFLQEKTNRTGKQQSVYYLFKAKIEDQDDPVLVIVGPYPAKESGVTLEESYNKVWVDEEPFSPSKINSAFKRMLTKPTVDEKVEK